MNILVIDDGDNIIEHLKADRTDTDVSIFFHEKKSEVDNDELKKIMVEVKGNNIDCIFSIGFIPTISLVAGALEIKYRVWITGGYDSVNYDFTIRNEWNEIYVADYFLYEEFTKLGVKNIHYLPLYPDIIRDSYKEPDIPTGNFLVWTDLPRKSGVSFGRFDELKDSSKGYIVGMSVSRTHNLVNEPLYDKFADYVKSDMEAMYPYEVTSLESLGHHYDYTLFYPEIQTQLSFPYFVRLRNEWDDYGDIDVVTDTVSDIFDTGINAIEKADFTCDMFRKYKIVIFIPELNNNGLITTQMWNAMAMGAFVMCSATVDFRVLGEDKPVTFKNTRELENKLRYYLKHDEERTDISNRIRTKVLSFGDLNSRLSDIFA